ncbi:UPF0481 protein At3g47200-like [Oryza glaberrima]|uniref:UPF0481 protein At3g47200-like n=1 Tax=Oryza glaberrima TaxID=4538 RepID=UPI00023E3B16|nr:UPF0481 protein At3g47200-like [Oryza glaberrima]
MNISRSYINNSTVEVTIIPPIQERVKKTFERLEADFCKNERKIHRFPQGLRRWIGGEGDRYIVPTFVALGPYHHGKPHLQKTEELKHAAAHYLCMKSGRSVEEVYAKVLAVAGEARGCYDNDDNAVAQFSDDEFAEMMFLDGCFLLKYMSSDYGCSLLTNRMVLSTGLCILRDIMLLENQIPWLVLDALMSTFSIRMTVVHMFLEMIRSGFIGSFRKGDIGRWADENSRPPHLLGLARSYLIIGIGMPPHEEEGIVDGDGDGGTFSIASSAVELKEIGIRVTPSKEEWFTYMNLKTDKLALHLLGELSLTPFFLNDFTACWLVNMAALEACTATDPISDDGFIISSYLSLLAMLMDKEEDVHELRAKGLIHSFFSNKEMLAFFKGFERHLRLGSRYFTIIQQIEHYKRNKRASIVIHKLVYNNWRIIVKLVSIASVIMGIFKAILSLKRP